MAARRWAWPRPADADLRVRPGPVHQGRPGPLRPGGPAPAALVDLPKFNGDQLEAARTGGDLCVQACADDPQVAFHAVRELVRLAYGAADLRWAQSGFMPNTPQAETPRNLMGFKDGTNNVVPATRSRRPTCRRASTRWSGSATRGRTGCAAAATWWRGASASPWSTGTAPRWTSKRKWSPLQIFRRPDRQEGRVRPPGPGPRRQGRQPGHRRQRPCAHGRRGRE